MGNIIIFSDFIILRPFSLIILEKQSLPLYTACIPETIQRKSMALCTDKMVFGETNRFFSHANRASRAIGLETGRTLRSSMTVRTEITTAGHTAEILL